MNKYYITKWSRTKGDYCEVYDENFECVGTVKGESVEGLTRIEKKGSITAALYDTEPLEKGYVKLLNRVEGAAQVAAAAFVK